jgi:hypothetical protein
MIRVLTLGLMRGDPSLADSATIISAIADFRSGNEQHNGLQLALLCWPKLLKSERHVIQAAVTDNLYIYPGQQPSTTRGGHYLPCCLVKPAQCSEGKKAEFR